jgi:hypothetical protein
MRISPTVFAVLGALFMFSGIFIVLRSKHTRWGQIHILIGAISFYVTAFLAKVLW